MCPLLSKLASAQRPVTHPHMWHSSIHPFSASYLSWGHGDSMLRLVSIFPASTPPLRRVSLFPFLMQRKGPNPYSVAWLEAWCCVWSSSCFGFFLICEMSVHIPRLHLCLPPSPDHCANPDRWSARRTAISHYFIWNKPGSAPISSPYKSWWASSFPHTVFTKAFKQLTLGKLFKATRLKRLSILMMIFLIKLLTFKLLYKVSRKCFLLIKKSIIKKKTHLNISNGKRNRTRRKK